MTATDPRGSLGEWLQEAYASSTGCLPIETLAEAAAGRVSSAEFAAIDLHVKACAACSAEWELARLFAADETEIAERQDDVDFVTSSLEARFTGSTPSKRPPQSAILSFPDPVSRRPHIQLLARIAAVLVLVVGLGAIVRNLGTEAPTLPTSGPDDVLRSATVETLSPRGEVARVPERLTWSSHPDAEAYRVRLTAVDGTVMLDTVLSSSTLDVPDSVQDRLHPLAVYHWQVEALGRNEALVAWSEKTEFRILGD